MTNIDGVGKAEGNFSPSSSSLTSAAPPSGAALPLAAAATAAALRGPYPPEAVSIFPKLVYSGEARDGRKVVRLRSEGSTWLAVGSRGHGPMHRADVPGGATRGASEGGADVAGRR